MGKPLSVSACVIMLADWIAENGRDPQTQECNSDNGLPHYKTVYKKCGSMPAALSAAHALLCGLSGVFAHFGTYHPPVSCMGVSCTRMVRWQGPNIRHCKECRKALFAEEPHLEPSGALPRHYYRIFWDAPLEEQFAVAWREDYE